jgi:hypothetical protein
MKVCKYSQAQVGRSKGERAEGVGQRAELNAIKEPCTDCNRVDLIEK